MDRSIRTAVVWVILAGIEAAFGWLFIQHVPLIPWWIPWSMWTLALSTLVLALDFPRR